MLNTKHKVHSDTHTHTHRLTDQVHELESLQQFAVPVFQAVGFVDHDTAPVELLQLRTVGHDHLKGGDHPVKLQNTWDGVTLRKAHLNIHIREAESQSQNY